MRTIFFSIRCTYSFASGENVEVVIVLVQREMENRCSPLAGIPPSSADQLGEDRATQVAPGELGGRLKLQLVSRKETRWVARAGTASVGEEQTG